MKAKRIFLSICITALSLVACNKAEQHFSFNRIHYDLKPGVTEDELEGSPWIDSNINGMLEKVEKPDLKDDFYASINYESIIDGTLGPFEQSSYNAQSALTSILDGSTSFPNENLFSYTKQLLLDGVGSTLKTNLDNLNLSEYTSSKQIFMGDYGLLNIINNEDDYFIYFNDGYNYEYGGIQSLAYIGYYSYWYPEYQPYQDAAISVLYNIFSSLGYSETIADSMSTYGVYYLQSLMFNHLNDLPQWNVVSDITVSGFKSALLDAGLSLEDNISIPSGSVSAIIKLYNGLNSEDALYYEFAIKSIYAFEHRHLIGASNYKPVSRILANMQLYFDEYDLSGYPNVRVARRLLTLMLPVLYEKAYIYLQGTQENKDIVEDLIVNILQAYKEMVSDVDWLTDYTKNAIITKLDKMGYTSCYSDDVKNFPAIDETNLYTMNLLDIYDDYHTTIVSLKVSGDFDIEDTISSGMHTYTVNAFYSPYDNKFVILNGIVTGGFIGESKEVTYGRIGAVIGHEISHAFDSSGALFNEYGEYRKSGWWDKKDMKKFKKKVAKLQKFWDNIIVHDDLNVKGRRIDGEATADMGGVGVMLKLAEKEENFNYQLFFKSYAEMWKEVYSSLDAIDQDSHPYAYLRTNVTVAQFDEFYKAFGIKKSDKMYIPKADRVKIW